MNRLYNALTVLWTGFDLDQTRRTLKMQREFIDQLERENLSVRRELLMEKTRNRELCKMLDEAEGGRKAASDAIGNKVIKDLEMQNKLRIADSGPTGWCPTCNRATKHLNGRCTEHTR